MRGIQFAVFVYVVVYTIVLRQAYMAEAPVIGNVRLQLRRPETQYRWPDGQAPYCSGANATYDGQYTYSAGGMYMYSQGSGLTAPQARCLYFDENFITLTPVESAATYMVTRVTYVNQVASPLPDCEAQAHSYCSFNTTSSNLTYVADTEMFTILVDHSFTTSAGITRPSTEMDGEMLSPSGARLDPCTAYATYTAGCPPYVAVGVAGKRDIFPLRTLLAASGIRTLDQVAGNQEGLDNETMRYAGIVVTLNIYYNNYMLGTGPLTPGTGSINNNYVKYFYIVSVIPNVDFKAEQAITPTQLRPSSTRTIMNTHGVRIVVTQSGRIGNSDFQQFLINVVVSLGLLSVATLLTDLVMLNVCPLRHLYAQYKTRRTVGMRDFRGGLTKETLSRIKASTDLVDPPSAELQELLTLAKSLRDEEERRRSDGVAALGALVPSTSNSHLFTSDGSAPSHTDAAGERVAAVVISANPLAETSGPRKSVLPVPPGNAVVKLWPA